MGKSKRLTQGHGNWVVGERFWDRETDIDSFIEQIDGGAHLLLVAQRRMGKTSLMREVKRRLEARYLCLFVDLQKAKNAPDAIVELTLATFTHASLWERGKKIFSNVITKISDSIEKVDLGEISVTLRAGLTARNWVEKGDQLFNVLAESDKPVLLLLDEVPLLVNRMLTGYEYVITPERKALADEFMSWLRDNSLRHQEKIRIVISGSIGLEPVLRQAQLSANINNFQPFELKPWDEQVAVSCIEALANQYGIELQDAVAAAMASKLGCCIPHHVQMFFSHVYDRCKRQDQFEVSVEDVDTVYNEEMLSVRGHAELSHYEERLKQVLGDELLPLALDMLTQAAIVGRLTRDALSAFQNEYTFEGRDVLDVQKHILWVLEHDGYLKQGPDAFQFISTLLRDWWKKRHGMFFVPVAERGN